VRRNILWKERNMREKLLLHVCCAPCSIAVLDELRSVVDVQVLFFNPNIFPEEEYRKRKKEVLRVCEEWNLPVIDMDYRPEEWAARVRGLENEPEQGKRCFTCIGMRLMRTAYEARERGFLVFGTTLTMGRRKSAKVIFPIGEAAARRYGISFYAEDWKKKGRENTARKMVKERGLYQQNYCGCRYSLQNEKFTHADF
jgi:predicted adenine nucleotide alpha hydrolase (AANH) superfamily ATPase